VNKETSSKKIRVFDPGQKGNMDFSSFEDLICNFRSVYFTGKVLSWQETKTGNEYPLYWPIQGIRKNPFSWQEIHWIPFRSVDKTGDRA
jgi:hypothetical protein